jgi:methyltransferase FkbM-like protein
VALSKLAQLALQQFPLPLADGLRAVRFSRKIRLEPWRFAVGGVPVEFLGEEHWIRLLREDDGTGKVTGMGQDGRYEGPFCDAFSRHLDRAGVLLDVGAAGGLYSVIAYQLGCRRIYAFEPAGSSRFVLRQNNRRYCQGTVCVDARFVGPETTANSVSLDDFCRGRGINPSLIKMDIEGGEIQALGGMSGLLHRSRPILLMEFHLRKIRRNFGVDPMEVPKQLQAAGYRVRYNGHHGYLATHEGAWDPNWHAELPNDVNCALLALPES